MALSHHEFLESKSRVCNSPYCKTNKILENRKLHEQSPGSIIPSKGFFLCIYWGGGGGDKILRELIYERKFAYAQGSSYDEESIIVGQVLGFPVELEKLPQKRLLRLESRK